MITATGWMSMPATWSVASAARSFQLQACFLGLGEEVPDRVKQERARAAGRIEHPLLDRRGRRRRRTILRGEPVRRVVLAEPVPLVAVDQRLVEDLEHVAFDLAEPEAADMSRGCGEPAPRRRRLRPPSRRSRSRPRRRCQPPRRPRRTARASGRRRGGRARRARSPSQRSRGRCAGTTARRSRPRARRPA